ncbi:MAG: hypothetical protein LQ339_008525 [Xanthoria mediterranea]|nr:MAG: hypothetical protein LQ339_008525 [Xanthoria mediterranea]
MPSDVVPGELGMMLQFFACLVLLLNISFALSATPPARKPQLPRIDSPMRIPDLPSNISDATLQFANITSYGGRPIGCFAQRKPPLTPLHLVDSMDCYTDMARALLLGDGVMDRGRWTGRSVPFSYAAGTCLIILDSDDYTAVDYFSEAEIAHAAAMITFPCVANNDLPLGGRMHIGVRGVYTVTVFGRVARPD